MQGMLTCTQVVTDHHVGKPINSIMVIRLVHDTNTQAL